MKRKLTAEQRLGAIVAEFLRRAPNTTGDWQRFRRALRALLRERADAAVDAAMSTPMATTQAQWDGIRAAVLGRRK